MNQWAEYKKQILSKIDDYSFIFSNLRNQRQSTDNWVVAQCPLHNDQHPSFAYNRKTGRWACMAGCGKGGPLDFVMIVSGQSFRNTLEQLGNQLGIPRPFLKQKERPPIEDKIVKRYENYLDQNEEIKRYLIESRGLSCKTLVKYQIGWDPVRRRYSIPVKNEIGKIVNIRLYNPDKNPKIINYTDGKYKYGSPARLYGIDELIKNKTRSGEAGFGMARCGTVRHGQAGLGSVWQVLICEGELDRLLLEQENLAAISGTHGCSVFRPEWVQDFKGMNVVVVYDCDKAGRTAVNNIVLKAFKNSEVNSIKVVNLPLKGDKTDKDVTDYFHKRGFTGADLQKLIDETPIYKYEEEMPEEEIVRLDSFIEIEQKEIIDKKIQCEITVCGETSEAFHAVTEFKINFCPKLKKGECFDCAESITVPRGSQEYIGSCMSNNIQVISMLRAFCCKYGQKPAIEILKRTTIKEFFCHQKVNRITHSKDEEGNIVQFIDGKKQELIEKRVYYLSSEHVKPGNYLVTGWIKTHPKTQQVTLLIESLVPQEDDFQAFSVQKNIEHLEAVRKLSIPDIITGIKENVTRIYKRDEILLAIMLTYCSPLHFRFNREVIRGWISTAIIGDSGTGKSQSYDRLAEYIGIGDIFSGLTGSRTGLAYALVDHKQKGWQVKIGRFPANSRKLLTVDEVQEVPPWQLKTIAKAMDEGFMVIDRISSMGFESMTRVIFLGNPKHDSIMDKFNFGCVTLREIFPVMVIRRLDMAVFVNANDIDDITAIVRRNVSHKKYKVTREMLRALIYWSWNLKPGDITITSDAETLCFEKSAELANKFGFATNIPIVSRYEAEKTLARISVAYAVLDGSADENFSHLIVSPVHVENSFHFLNCIYSHENCMLGEFSELKKNREKLLDYEEIQDKFIEVAENEKHAEETKHAFSQLIYSLWTIGFDDGDRESPIKRSELADMVGCHGTYISEKIRLLKRYNLIESTRAGYIKLPKFIRFMRRFLRENKEFFKGKYLR